MKREFDATLLTELGRTQVPGTAYSIVEYSYNGKPRRIKVVQTWEAKGSQQSKENVILKGIEMADLMKILPVLNAVTTKPFKTSGKVIRKGVQGSSSV